MPDLAAVALSEASASDRLLDRGRASASSPLLSSPCPPSMSSSGVLRSKTSCGSMPCFAGLSSGTGCRPDGAA